MALIMENKNLLTSANLVPLGMGIAIGAGALILLISFWPLALLTGAGFFAYKTFPEPEEYK